MTTAAGAAWTVLATSSGTVPDTWSSLATTPTEATVPGEVYCDLMAANAIPDPFDGDNESLLSWIGRTDWTYRTTFAFSRGNEQRHDLVADGLDTVATIRLNGTEVARTANQHRSYRFDVTDLLVDGDNELVIDFEAPVTAAERLSEEIGPRPQVGNQHPFNAIRKMASNYGWDWGPDVAGVGIWKSIGIESWSGVRIAAVRPLASLDGTDGILETHVDLDWQDPATSGPLSVTVEVGGNTASAQVPAGQRSVVLTAKVEQVDQWWPSSHGTPHLYDVAVGLHSGGDDLDGWQGRVGFRTIELRTEPDSTGVGFVFVVNGEPVYIKGANWIPDDAFVTRITAEKYTAGIREAVEAGMNMLRIWGGGLYESEDFYNTCDELGVLVWQDFLFACATYSEDEPLRSEVEAEARQAITRLSRHASLALWNGCNENIWGYVEWNWLAPLAGRSWGDGYYTELLPALVAELDPRTSYSPGSPFSYAKYHHPNDPRSGTMHIWDVWNQKDYSHYRDYPARFASEFGFQGPAAWSTLTRVVHDQPLDPYGPQMLVHQKAADGNAKLERGLGDHLPKWSTVDGVADMDDWHWLTQLNQARAVAYGIEHLRSHFPLNQGAIIWQLNDNWPVVSWAAVDADGIRKPLWHALRRVYAERLVTIQPRDGVPTLIAHNDSADGWTGDLVVSRRGTGAGGQVLASQVVPLDVAPRSAVTIALDEAVITPTEDSAEYVVAVADGIAPAFWYFVEDTALQLTPIGSAADVSVSRGPDGFQVTVAANALVKDLALFPDRLDAAARVDSGLVTLLPGESHTFTVSGADLDAQALVGKPVLRSVNDVVAG
nr:glycoside hydrolase family 2 protein [Microlunatus panaciterrae]